MAASTQMTPGKRKSRRQRLKQCCRTFGICMDRLPFWSLSSFLLCVVGITMFSGGLYATAEQVIHQLDLPIISVAIWGLFVLHIVIAAFFLLVAALSTGETRREASNMCRFCNLLGRWCLIGNIVTAYILHFIWYLLPLALFFPTGVAVGGSIACHVTPQCINLTERGVPQLIIDHIKPSEYVQYVRSFNASYYDQYIDQAEGFVETAIDSLENSPMLDQIITFVEKNIPSENETDALIGQIVKTIDPERIAAMLDTMQERVDEGLDMFEEAGQTVAAKIEEIDLSQLDQMMGELFNNTKDFNLTAFIEEYGDIDESFFEQIANATDSAFDTLDEYATLNGTTMPGDPGARARKRRHLVRTMIAAERRRRYRRNAIESKSEEEQRREQLTDELLRRLEDADHSTPEDREELEAVLKTLELTPEETKKLMTMMKTDAEAKRDEARALIDKGISRGENDFKKIEDAYNELQQQALKHVERFREILATVDAKWTAKEIESRAQELGRRLEALGTSSADGFKQEYRDFLEQNGARFSEYLRLSSELKAEMIQRLSEIKDTASEEGQKFKQTLASLDLSPEDIEALLNMGSETTDEAKRRTDEILSRHLKRIASNREKLNDIAKDLENQVQEKLQMLQAKYAISEIDTAQLEDLADNYIERLRNLNKDSLAEVGDELRTFLASKGITLPDFNNLVHTIETEMMRQVFALGGLAPVEVEQLQAMLEALGMSRENVTKLLDFGKNSTDEAKRMAKQLLEEYLASAWSKEAQLKEIAQHFENKIMKELEELRVKWLSEYEGLLTEEDMEKKLGELARRAFRLSGGNIEQLESQTKHFLAQYGILLPPDVQLVDGLRDELLARLKAIDGLASTEAARLRDMLLAELGITEAQAEYLMNRAINFPNEAKDLLNGYLNKGLEHKEKLEAMAHDLQKQLLGQIDDLRRQVLENVGNLTTDMIEQKAKELASRVNDLTGGHLQNLHENARQFLEQYGGEFSDYAVLGAAIKDELLRRLHSLKDALPEDIKNVEVMLANVGLGRKEIDVLLELAQGNTEGAKDMAKAFLEEGMRRGLEEKERLEKVAKELEKKVLEEVENLRLMALNAQAKGQEFAAAAQVRAIELARRVQELGGGGVEGMTEEARRFLEQYGGRFSNYEELAANVKNEIMRRISELQNTSTAQAKELQEMLMKEMGLKRDEALQLLELGKSQAARAQAEARALLDKGLKRGHELKEKLEQVAKELEQQVLKEVEELQRQAREKFGELTGKAGELGAEFEERARDLARRVQELSGGNPENMTDEVRKFLEQRGAHFLEDAREVYKQLGNKLEEAKRQARELAREMQAAARQMAKDAKKAAQRAAVEAAILLQRAEELTRQAAMEVDAVKKLAAEQAAAKAREAANAARGMATSAFSKARDVVKNADVLLKTAASGALGQLREIAKNLRRYVSEFIGHARYYVDEGATLARQTAVMLETNRDAIADTYVQYAGLTQRYLAITKVGNDTYCSNNKDALCYEVKKAGVGMVFVFLSCFVIKISMIHFLMCMSANYVHLKREEEMERFRLMELLDKDQQDYEDAKLDNDVNFMMSDTGSLVDGIDKQSI